MSLCLLLGFDCNCLNQQIQISKGSAEFSVLPTFAVSGRLNNDEDFF